MTFLRQKFPSRTVKNQNKNNVHSKEKDEIRNTSSAIQKMANLKKKLENIKHPNSRKTKALSKQAKRLNNKHKSRLGHAIKSNIIGEKLNWFLGNLGDRTSPLSPEEFEELIKLYLSRFDEELEQIALKQSISKNRANQHAARQDVIKITLEKEKNEFFGGGMEMINLCDPVKFASLMEWDGNAINVQHLKFDLISNGMLQRLKKPNPSIVVTPCSDGEQSMDVSISAS